ncbi:MAG: BPSS1780 family membrane protein [Burkholderiales bacterium]|nr:BPSS1780 family membrane protein [Burkholderiales bacterium]
MIVVPSHHGWRWLARGWMLFTASPFMWLTMIFAYWLLVGFIGLVPVVGAAAAVVLIPVFSVSFMAMCRALERRRPLDPGLLFAGFRANLPALLTLGGVYLVASAAILFASTLADDGHLMRWMVAGTPVPPEAFATGSVLNAALLALALYLPVLAAFWFAPVLAAWDAMPRRRRSSTASSRCSRTGAPSWCTAWSSSRPARSSRASQSRSWVRRCTPRPKCARWCRRSC